MKKLVMSVVGVAMLCGSAAFAADMPVKARPAPLAPPPSPWDVAFGGAIMSDYNFRGISQSDRGPSVFAYVEGQYNVNPNLQLYLATAGASVKLPSDPAAEIDFYGGFRPKFGPVTFDFGAWYYYYPKEFNLVTLTTIDTDFWEFYGKLVWEINSSFSLNGGIYYAPDWLQTGADGTYFVGGAKLTAPENFFPNGIGAYLSGEFAHYSFGTPDIGFTVFNYNYWHVGFGFTWSAFTLDFRYHDTDLSQTECDLMAGSNGRKWCGEAFIVKLSFDTAVSKLK